MVSPTAIVRLRAAAAPQAHGAGSVAEQQQVVRRSDRGAREVLRRSQRALYVRAQQRSVIAAVDKTVGEKPARRRRRSRMQASDTETARGKVL